MFRLAFWQYRMILLTAQVEIKFAKPSKRWRERWVDIEIKNRFYGGKHEIHVYVF